MGAPYLSGVVYIVWVSIHALCSVIGKAKGRNVLTKACASCQSIIGQRYMVPGVLLLALLALPLLQI
jgi:hypothetical protein